LGKEIPESMGPRVTTHSTGVCTHPSPSEPPWTRCCIAWLLLLLLLSQLKKNKISNIKVHKIAAGRTWNKFWGF
jgi:hypothetical protein